MRCNQYNNGNNYITNRNRGLLQVTDMHNLLLVLVDVIWIERERERENQKRRGKIMEKGKEVEQLIFLPLEPVPRQWTTHGHRISICIVNNAKRLRFEIIWEKQNNTKMLEYADFCLFNLFILFLFFFLSLGKSFCFQRTKSKNKMCSVYSSSFFICVLLSAPN